MPVLPSAFDVRFWTAAVGGTVETTVLMKTTVSGLLGLSFLSDHCWVMCPSRCKYLVPLCLIFGMVVTETAHRTVAKI